MVTPIVTPQKGPHPAGARYNSEYQNVCARRKQYIMIIILSSINTKSQTEITR